MRSGRIKNRSVALPTEKLLQISFRFPWAPQGAAGFRACVLAIFEHLHAIYENVLHAYRILMRFLIRGPVGNRHRIEYDHIGKHPLLEEPAMMRTVHATTAAQYTATGIDL